MNTMTEDQVDCMLLDMKFLLKLRQESDYKAMWFHYIKDLATEESRSLIRNFMREDFLDLKSNSIGLIFSQFETNEAIAFISCFPPDMEEFDELVHHFALAYKNVRTTGYALSFLKEMKLILSDKRSSNQEIDHAVMIGLFALALHNNYSKLLEIYKVKSDGLTDVSLFLPAIEKLFSTGFTPYVCDAHKLTREQVVKIMTTVPMSAEIRISLGAYLLKEEL